MNRNDKEFIVQKIRTQYTEKENTQLEALKKLDAKVKKPAIVFGYVFGSLSAIIMGSGMSLVMTDIGEKLELGDMMVHGIVIGVIGMGIVVVAYPVYTRILKKEREKIAPEILRLTEEIMH